MSLYETFKGFTLFPACLILAMFVGLLAMLRWRRAGMTVLWATLIVFYVFSAPFFASRFAHWVQSVPPLIDPARARDAQAIVVLSAGASPDGPEYGGVTVDQITTMRLRYAAHLYRVLKLPILVSGGKIFGTSTTLAGAMQRALEQDFAVPVTWVEDRSADTGANARFSAAILHKAGVHKIVLVTHASHMPRAAALFRATGLEVVPAPTSFAFVSSDFPRDLVPRMSAFETSYLAVYEALGGLWYRIRPTPSEADDVRPLPPEAGP
jgi:uncharacterized SAM-binding protein YcdF (DUF218 family)